MRFDSRIAVLAAFALILPGCDRGQAPAASGAATAPAEPPGGWLTRKPPPQSLAYAGDTFQWTVGAAIEPLAPAVEGGHADFFKVEPPLPPGLTLDAATGILKGTPEAAAPRQAYQFTAANAWGAARTTLTLQVSEKEPGQAAVTLPPFVSAGRDGLSASTQDQGKGATYQWTLQGGSITGGQGTPVITFRAGEPGTLTAQVAVTAPGGGRQAQASTTVVPLPVAAITAPTPVRSGAGGLRASTQAQADMEYTWTILPGQAGAAITSGQGTPSILFTASGSEGTFQIQVEVKNKAGDVASSAGTVQVLRYAGSTGS